MAAFSFAVQGRCVSRQEPPVHGDLLNIVIVDEQRSHRDKVVIVLVVEDMSMTFL
jgi:hypothetical protein